MAATKTSRKRPRGGPATVVAERPLPGLVGACAPAASSISRRVRATLQARTRASLWSQLEADAARIARRFGLAYRKIEPEREGVRAHYGITYSDGTIRIRLRHATTGRPLKYSSLINTICHELAHLRHFDHSERFRRYYCRILDWARGEGLYRPSTTDPLPPVQLALFRQREPCGAAPERPMRLPAHRTMRDTPRR